MAMRPVNLLGQSAQHRTVTPAVIIGFVNRPGSVASAWRGSSCALAPCRLSLRQCPSRCAATAPAQSPPVWNIDTSCENVMGRLRETEKLKNCLGAPLTEDEQRSLIRCLDSARLGVDTCLVDGLEALRDHLMSYIEAVAVSQADDLELVEGAMLLMEQLSLALGTVTVLPAVRKTRNSTCPGPRASSSHMADSDSASLSMSYSVSLSGEGREELLEAPQEAVADGRFSGQWQVLVTTGGGWPYGRLQYVPVIELLDISEDGRTFRLESKAGPLYLVAAGEVAWGDSGRRGREDNGDHSHPNQLDRLHLQYHATEFRVEILGRSLALPPPTPDNELRVFALAPCTALARSTAGGMQLMARPA